MEPLSTSNTLKYASSTSVSAWPSRGEQKRYVISGESEMFDAEAWFQTPEMQASEARLWLEVQVSWKGGILDIGHYQTPQRLTFGFDPKADFCYPLRDLPQDSMWRYFPLIEPTKGGFLFCFDAEMDGVIEHNGERFRLLELVKEGRAHSFSRTGLCYYPLFPGVLVRLQCEGLEVAIRFVSPPLVHSSVFRSLGTLLPALSFSVLLHVLFLFLAWAGISSSLPPTPTHPPSPSAQSRPREAVAPRQNPPSEPSEPSSHRSRRHTQASLLGTGP